MANCDVELRGKVKVSTGIAEWNRVIKAKTARLKANGTLGPAGYLECAETDEIPNAFICVAADLRNLNLAFARLSRYADGSVEGRTKTVISRAHTDYVEGLLEVEGHDIQDRDLRGFYSQAKRLCETRDQDYCLNANEKELYRILLEPHFKLGEPIVVIAYSLNGKMDPLKIVSHEIVHAQYYQSEKFREVVGSYWLTEVSVAEKKYVRAQLESMYDTRDDLLMRNEFQAYMLMNDGEKSRLKQLVPSHRSRLLEILKKEGIEPVQVR